MKVADCVPGMVVGRLRVIETFYLLTGYKSASPRSRKLFALCRCSCGNLKTIPLPDLGDKTQSCGCLRKEVTAARGRIAMRTHGWGRGKYRRVYDIARGAWRRCNDPNTFGWKWYGARGIEFRFESYVDMCRYIVYDIPDGVERCLDPRYSIDRIDNDGHYEPGNLRWATDKEQMANRRVSSVTAGG